MDSEYDGASAAPGEDESSSDSVEGAAESVPEESSPSCETPFENESLRAES
jgi:hypothetical protein